MKKTKILTMGSLAALFWVLAWFTIKTAIYGSLSLLWLFWPSLLIIFGIVFLTFFFLVNKNRIISFILDAVIVSSYLLIMPKDPYVASAGLIFLGLLVLFEQRVRVEAKSRMHFSIRSTVGSSVSLTIYALLLVVGFNVFHSIAVDFNRNPQPYYDKLAKATVSTVPYVIKTNPTLSAIIAQDAVSRVREIAQGYEQYLPVTFAFVVTGLLWTFAFLLRWATSIVAWLIFQLLLWMKFFKLEKEMVEIDKLGV